MAYNDIKWGYYPTASPNQAPLTVIYSLSTFQNGLGITYSVSNTIVSNNVVSVLTLLDVTYDDNFNTYICACSNITISGCSSFATATIIVPSIFFFNSVYYNG